MSLLNLNLLDRPEIREGLEKRKYKLLKVSLNEYTAAEALALIEEQLLVYNLHRSSQEAALCVNLVIQSTKSRMAVYNIYVSKVLKQ